MRRILYSSFATLLVCIGSGGCAGPGPGPAASAPASSAAKERETANKRAGLELDLTVAREKAQKAQRDQADQELAATAALAKTKGDLDLAQVRLSTFDEKEAPAKLANAKLALQGARDQLDEAKEELEQLELMYKEQDLADKTREIVIRRAKRQLARTEERLSLQTEDLKTLEERTLPEERMKLALDHADKQRTLGSTQRSNDAAALDRRIAVLTAGAEIERLERELASLNAEPKATP